MEKNTPTQKIGAWLGMVACLIIAAFIAGHFGWLNSNTPVGNLIGFLVVGAVSYFGTKAILNRFKKQ